MPEVGFTNLLVVCVIALVAPLAVGFAPRVQVPAVVLEIMAGVVLGPSVLGWVEVDLPVSSVAVLGLAFLLFLAGLKIDVHHLRGGVLRVALAGYAVTLLLGLAVGGGLDVLGWASSPVLIAVTLSATSLGLVVPVLKDAGRLDGSLGQTVVAAASVADFAAIVLLSLFFSTSESGTGTRLALLGVFAALVGLTAVAALTVARSMTLSTVVTRLQDTTAEIRVRAAVLLLVGFVALVSQLGLETILGAFLAGTVVGLVDKDTSSHRHFRTKLEALGFGFLIPVFFMASGLRLDPAGLVDDRSALVRVRGRHAPGEAHQGPVVDLLLLHWRPACPVGHLGGQQAGPHRLTQRVASGEVADHRQGRDDLCQRHLAAHGASLGVAVPVPSSAHLIERRGLRHSCQGAPA